MESKPKTHIIPWDVITYPCHGYHFDTQVHIYIYSVSLLNCVCKCKLLLSTSSGTVQMFLNVLSYGHKILHSWDGYVAISGVCCMWLSVGYCCELWASYQIRKIAGCACAGNVGNVFPATDFKGNHLLAIPACITARAPHTCRDACRDC